MATARPVNSSWGGAPGGPRAPGYKKLQQGDPDGGLTDAAALLSTLYSFTSTPPRPPECLCGFQTPHMS